MNGGLLIFSSMSLTFCLGFPGSSTLGRLCRAFPLSFSSGFPALTCLAVSIQPRAMNSGDLHFAASWAENSPFHDSFGFSQDLLLPRLQSPNLPESSSPNTVLCPIWAGKAGRVGVTQPRNELTSSLCAPACTAGTQPGPALADVFLVPA